MFVIVIQQLPWVGILKRQSQIGLIVINRFRHFLPALILPISKKSNYLTVHCTVYSLYNRDCISSMKFKFSEMSSKSSKSREFTKNYFSGNHTVIILSKFLFSLASKPIPAACSLIFGQLSYIESVKRRLSASLSSIGHRNHTEIRKFGWILRLRLRVWSFRLYPHIWVY